MSSYDFRSPTDSQQSPMPHPMQQQQQQQPPPPQQQQYQQQQQQQQQPPPYPGAYPAADYQAFPDPRAYQNPTPPTATLTSEGVPPVFSPLNSPGVQQPVYDPSAAVNNAFDNSSAASQVPPDIIAQITQQVIASLQGNGTGAQQPPVSPYHPAPPIQPLQGHPPLPQQQHQPPPIPSHFQSPPPPPQPYVTRSATASTNNSLPPQNNTYNPPSPQVDRHGVESSSSSPVNTSEDFAQRVSREDMADRYVGKPKAAQEEQQNTNGKEDLSNRFAVRERSVPRFDGMNGRPNKPTRTMTNEEETTLEKIWQPLFEDNQPTKRLGQFLRGLALHIIEDYEPKNSLVITPQKMQRFYEQSKLAPENYPWRDIFDLPNGQISRIYRELKCEHHFVQNYDRNHEEPSIPSLTPRGFQSFLTYLIMAHPDHEFDRLAKAVLDMPISNADDRKERFPKQISRRLFPKLEDSKMKQRCVSLLSVDGKASQPRPTSAYYPPPPPPPQPREPSMTGSFERSRAPYSHASQPPSRNASEHGDDSSDNDSTPLAIPIERERKPYTAKEGTGKVYGGDSMSSSGGLKPDSLRDSRLSDSSTSGSGYPPPPPPPANRLNRANSSAGRTSGTIPVIRHHRSPSFNSESREGLGIGGGFTRSENSVGDIPQGYYSSNIYADPDQDDDNSLRRESTREREYRREKDRHREGRAAEWAKRAAEEERYSQKYSDNRADDTRFSKEYIDDYYRRYGKLPSAPNRNYA